MKKFSLLLATILYYAVGHSQIFSTIPTPDNRNVEFDTVIKDPSKTKKVLYQAAKLWIVETFASAENVTQLDDFDGGIIVIRSTYHIWVNTHIAPLKTRMESLIKIYFKEGSYRFRIEDVKYRCYPGVFNGVVVAETVTYPYTWYFPIEKPMVKTRTQYRDETIKALNTIVSNFLNAMQKAKGTNDDW